VTLEQRQGRILQVIVDDYVATAEPVGSEYLARNYDFGCRGATLRNDMSEMSMLGFLVQPHTSSGRIPTPQGYRYYVNRLMTVPDHAPQASFHAGAQWPDRPDVEDLVQAACRLLSELTRYPCVASPPVAHAAHLVRVFVAPASLRHILVVLLFSTGQVEHRVVEFDPAPSAAVLDRVTGFIDAELAGADVAHLAAGVSLRPSGQMEPWRNLIDTVGREVLASARSIFQGRVFLEGTEHMLRQREFRDVTALERLLQVLAEHDLLSEVFSRSLTEEGVMVSIGPESGHEAMSFCSIVSTPYMIGDQAGGFIGVLGPTRMPYGAVVAHVSMVARELSAVLTRSSLC
jgi:heat-inducible transcriptional repressor